jgi:hypothetical protein
MTPLQYQAVFYGYAYYGSVADLANVTPHMVADALEASEVVGDATTPKANQATWPPPGAS